MKFLDPIPTIEIEQPIGVFYLAKIKAKDLLSIANKNLSRYEDVERGLQRDRSPKQVKDIEEYVLRDNATFPNTIIINIGYDESGEPNWNYDPVSNLLYIKDREDVANVLDGQHRLFGLSKKPDFEIPVSIFLGLPFSEQGAIFATINSNQRNVDKSLVYELFGLSDRRIEESIAYNIVSALNSDKDSPWFNKVKMLGRAKNDGDISQGSFSKFIHENLLSKNKIMRGLYESEKDEVIYRILLEYFKAVKECFPEEWENENKKYILTKTTGFNAFMSFLIDLANLSKIQNKSLDKTYFLSYLHRTKSELKTLTNTEYPSGAIGQNKIRDILRSGLTSEEKTILGIK